MPPKQQQGKGKARQSKQAQRTAHKQTAIPQQQQSYEGQQAQAQPQETEESEARVSLSWRERKEQQLRKEKEQTQSKRPEDDSGDDDIDLMGEEDDYSRETTQHSGSSSSSFPPTVVKPGDEVTETIAKWTTKLKLGFGLHSDGDVITVTTPGLLRLQKPNKFYVESSHRRYFPAVEDPIIATVSDKTAEAYKVHINGTQPALLPLLAFEGASKRNRPNLDIGSVVYARVVVADRYMEPEVSCKVASGPTKDWVTGQSLYGELKGGHVQKCSINLARTLLNPRCPVLETLGRALPFELAVGVNGYFWVKAEKIQHVILITNAILQSEYASEAEAVKLAKDMLRNGSAS